MIGDRRFTGRRGWKTATKCCRPFSGVGSVYVGMARVLCCTVDGFVVALAGTRSCLVENRFLFMGSALAALWDLIDLT